MVSVVAVSPGQHKRSGALKLKNILHSMINIFWGNYSFYLSNYNKLCIIPTDIVSVPMKFIFGRELDTDEIYDRQE